MAVTVADVERLDANGWKSLSSDRKQALLDDAQREYDTIYDSRNSRFPTLEGDKDVFIKNLTAHKWELAEGGEASSEGGQGGSTSYVTGSADEYLTLTRFGKTALRHIRNDESVAIVRNYR
jgi:hypothetical protein